MSAVESCLMNIVVRDAKVEDAESIVTAHFSAVHQTAAKDYAQEILDEWSSSNLSERVAKMEQVIKNSPEGEVMIVAELDGRVVGFGSIVPKKNELRAVYVSAEAGSRGVGQAILEELESKARKLKVPELNLDSSFTAEHFYVIHGYQVVERSQHTLSSGRKMGCVIMRKVIWRG